MPKSFSKQYICLMQKICEKCHQLFDCNMENIMQCQCYGLVLTKEASQFISNTYQDCICINCLNETKDTLIPTKII